MTVPSAHQQPGASGTFYFSFSFPGLQLPPTSLSLHRARASSFIKIKFIKVSRKEEHKKNLWGNKSSLPSVVSKESGDCVDRTVQSGRRGWV